MTTEKAHSAEQELMSMLSATQLLSSEVELHRLLAKLMETILEYTAAQTTHLILQTDDNLCVAASAKVTKDDLDVSQTVSILQPTEVAESVVQLTLQTGAQVVFSSDVGLGDGRFSQDLYLQNQKTLSILSLPVQYKEKTNGVLYLENSSSTNPFSKKDIKLSQLLAAQAAISLENAFLHEELTQALIKHKKTKKQLRTVDNRFKMAIEAGNLGVWDWEIITNEVTWSDYVELIFGLQQGEFDGTYEAYLALIHPDDLQLVQENIETTLATPTHDYHINHRLIWPTGEVRWLEAAGKVYRDQQGVPIHMTGYVLDITKRKAEEQYEQEREYWLERVLQLAKTITAVTDWDQCLKTLHQCVQTGLQFDRVGIFTYDPQTHIIQGAYGTSRSGKREDTRWFQQDARTEPTFAQVIADPRGFQYIANLAEEIEQERDGEMYGVSEHVTVSIWANDEPFAALTVDNGISQQRMNEHQLKALRVFAGYAGLALENARLLDQFLRQEERLQIALNAAQMGTWNWDLATEFVSWTEHVTLLHGFTKEEGGTLETRKLWSKIHPLDKINLHTSINGIQQVDQSSFRSEYRVLLDNDNIRWLEVVGKRINDRTSGLPIRIYGTVCDITARKEAESEREQMIAELESRNAELERFTYTVSHDLKSPLITIRGFLGLLERDIKNDDQVKVARDMERIHAAAGHMLTLLDDLLELSRIGRLTNPPTAVFFNDLATEAIELVTGHISERGVTLVVQPDCPTIYVDKARVVEVLQNLIDNATKFMGEQATPTIEIGAYATETEIVCFVKDNGIGIEAHYLERIFNLFERLNPDIDGTGIGLTLIKRIVEFHNGRIWAESDGDNKGSTFFFTLPPAKTDNTQ